jgi:hypothetical protein
MSINEYATIGRESGEVDMTDQKLYNISLHFLRKIGLSTFSVGLI